jgi:hypothetical protein
VKRALAGAGVAGLVAAIGIAVVLGRPAATRRPTPEPPPPQEGRSAVAPGDLVWALYGPLYAYPATVLEVDDGVARVLYEDGDLAAVRLEDLRPFGPVEGLEVTDDRGRFIRRDGAALEAPLDRFRVHASRLPPSGDAAPARDERPIGEGRIDERWRPVEVLERRGRAARVRIGGVERWLPASRLR